MGEEARHARRLLARVRQRARVRDAARPGQGEGRAGSSRCAPDGKILWRRPLPSRTESSPLFDNDRVYFGSENGTVYALRAGDGAVRWTFKAVGRGQGRAGAGQRQALLRRLQRPRVRDPPADGGKVWSTGTKGATFGLRAGRFYSTPAVAFGRVYIGNTDGKMYSFSSENGKLAWTKGTGSYVYSSPAVAQIPG